MADEEVDEAEWEEVRQSALELWRAAAAASAALQREGPRGGPEVGLLTDLEMATAMGWALLQDA